MSVGPNSEIVLSEIDQAYLDDLTGGDVEFVVELMNAFLGSTPELMREIAAAVESGNVESVLYASHTLKGSCRSIGATKAADCAAEVEAAARRQDMAAIRSAYPPLRESVDMLLVEAQRLVRV